MQPTLSDEERVLQLLTDRIAAERAAAAQREAAEAAQRVQATMGSAVPPLRRPGKLSSTEQAAKDAEDQKKAAAEDPSCTVQ